MRPFLAALAACALLAPPAPAAPNRHFDDAALHAVQFIDAKEGWAVGDEGVVWHTIDGGETWERQPTGVRASLCSLHFLDPFHGWVAGREELPHGAGSVGVLLYTKDGGLSWQRVLSNAVPGLNHVRFGDVRTGHAVGDGSEQYPSGVFRTTDGGRNWEPVRGPRCPAWLHADFADGKTGALAGAWGRLATLRDGEFGTARIDQLGIRSVRAVQLRERRGLAVGPGGLILTSESGGSGWGYGNLNLPAEARAAWDFHAIHCAGEHAWVVGRPGSVLLHSGNGGKTWEVQKTPQQLPLNGVFFFDTKRGWAVGELGTILATGDGGKTWAVQRRGGQRAGVLFVHARAADVPVDTLAVLGLEEGHLAACVRVAAPDARTEALVRASDPQRFAAAVRQAGGAAAEVLWQFPLPQHHAGAEKAELLKFWGTLHGGDAGQQLLRQLVLALRVWRPDVVVTDHADARVSGSHASALVTEALLEACKMAADPKAFPEQIEQLGLQPWTVSKLYAHWDKQAEAQVVMDGNRELSRLEAAPRDFAEPAADLLSDGPHQLPPQRAYKLLASTVEGAAQQRHLITGLGASKHGTASRELEALTKEPDEASQKASRARRTLRTLAETPVAGIADPGKLLAQLRPALAGLPDQQGAGAAFAIGSAYARQGQWGLAREAFLLMAESYPTHPRTIEAYRWLVRHGSSSEARRRHELGQFISVTHTSVVKPAHQQGKEPVKPAGYRETPSGAFAKEKPVQDKSRPPVPEVVRHQHLVHLRDMEEARAWYKRSLELGERLAEFGPLFASDPSIQFCLQAARRQLGEFKKAQEFYAGFKTHHAEGPWHEAAASELWVANRSGPPPRPVAVCRQASDRPYLDGEFDDACWQGLKPMVLRDAAEETAKEYATEVRLAYDRDFLYVALRCKHPAGQRVEPVKPRPRDADLRPYDRVSILLDLDRDYSTCFRLEVDQRGCVCEDCWGDRTWDPRWFVALKSGEDFWQIEAAVPLRELTGEAVNAGTVWACNVVRVLPRRGVQAWSMPAGVEPRPEGLGLLFFQPAQPAADARLMPRVP